VWPLGVVVAPPALDDDPGLSKRVEDLSIKQFVAKPGVEALNEAVLLGTAPLNVGRLGPDGSDPVLHGLGEGFRSVVGSDVFGHATQNELIEQYVDHVGGLELPVDPDGQTFVGELVDEVEHAILPPFVRAILDEVIGPDVVVLRLQILHPLDLIAPQPAVLLTPAIIRHLSDANGSDRIGHHLPCDVSTSTWRSFATISSGL
jgi:hypothetical protein